MSLDHRVGRRGAAAGDPRAHAGAASGGGLASGGDGARAHLTGGKEGWGLGTDIEYDHHWSNLPQMIDIIMGI